jgi:hemolysin
MRNILLPITLTLLASNAIAEKYVPIIQTGIILTRSAINCNLALDYDNTTGQYDFCEGQGSVDIRFNLTQMRSVQSASSTGVTENKKYAHFTIDSDKPGAGFHVSNNLKQDHSWFQSWSHRYDYLGGFSDDYQIKITPTSGFIPTMLKNLPNNENRNYQHQDTDGFSIGVSGTAGASVGAEGPTGSAEVSASYTYTKSRTLIFDTKDYKIVNRSSGANFDVTFEYDVTLCNSGNGGSGVYGCSWTDVLWGGGWVYDKSKITPIAYANFKPNGEALYEASVDQQGSTLFKLEANFKPQVVYGKVVPSPLYQVASGVGQSWINYDFGIYVDIDWAHPLFEPEAHVVLQSLDNNDTCVTAQGVDVKSNACNSSWSQIWGLDTDSRYRSRSGLDRCMTVKNDLSVLVESCNQSLNQKWFWENEHLISRFQDGNNTKYVLNIPTNGQALTVTSDKGSMNSDLMPRLTNISL